jgi:hypothetical protein
MQSSYFALPNPFAFLGRLLNPERHHATVMLRGTPLTVSWTRRAERQLARREAPLLAEMQLYFSCVVKKRVVFHPPQGEAALEWLRVVPQLLVAFRPVEANSCDPREFAANFPVRRQFDSRGAQRMHPAQLHLDYSAGEWRGEFTL